MATRIVFCSRRYALGLRSAAVERTAAAAAGGSSAFTFCFLYMREVVLVLAPSSLLPFRAALMPVFFLNPHIDLFPPPLFKLFLGIVACEWWYCPTQIGVVLLAVCLRSGGRPRAGQTTSCVLQ